MDDVYRTEDKNQAAFLRAMGHEVVDTTCSESGFVSFGFAACPDLSAAANAYIMRTATIEPNALIREQGTIRGMIDAARHRAGYTRNRPGGTTWQ